MNFMSHNCYPILQIIFFRNPPEGTPPSPDLSVVDSQRGVSYSGGANDDAWPWSWLTVT